MNSIEEQFYEIAAQEVAERRLIAAILAKAFSEADGDERKTVARYLKLRVEQLEIEYLQRLADVEQRQKAAEIEARRQEELARRQKSCLNCKSFARTGGLRGWVDTRGGICQLHQRRTYAHELCDNHAWKE